MNIRKKIAFGILILTMLSCNTVTQMIVPPTATALPTATATATITLTPTPTEVALVPAFIPPECASTPLATIAPDIAAQATPEKENNAEISRNEQLNILRDLERIVEKIYVYPDYNGKDWNEIQSRYQSKIEAGLDSDTFYTEMENMISELGDEHSFFLSPLDVKQSEDELKGDVTFTGVGIYGSFDMPNQHIVVISIFPDSPADHAGIKPHDSVVSVDNLPVFNGDRDRLRGPECSAVVVSIKSPGEAPRQVMLVRQSINGNLRIDARLVPTTDGSKIGYMFIPTFFDETVPPQIEKALKDFGTLDGLILDVRMNGGGSSEVVNPILSYFTSGRLGKFVSRSDSRALTVRSNPIANSQTVPIVVIVSKDTVSYGEIFAGIMRDSRGAKITGETSLGNVELLHGFDFDDGSEMWLAAEKFVPEHSPQANWEDTGIVPDVPAFADWDTITFENDPSIVEAVTLLGHK
jgi:carboxyl-terminal processing protease